MANISKHLKKNFFAFKILAVYKLTCHKKLIRENSRDIFSYNVKGISLLSKNY